MTSLIYTYCSNLRYSFAFMVFLTEMFLKMSPVKILVTLGQVTRFSSAGGVYLVVRKSQIIRFLFLSVGNRL